jgi:hypothetical protein
MNLIPHDGVQVFEGDGVDPRTRDTTLNGHNAAVLYCQGKIARSFINNSPLASFIEFDVASMEGRDHEVQYFLNRLVGHRLDLLRIHDGQNASVSHLDTVDPDKLYHKDQATGRHTLKPIQARWVYAANMVLCGVTIEEVRRDQTNHSRDRHRTIVVHLQVDHVAKNREA